MSKSINTFLPSAEVVELVDTLGSGSSGGFSVEVRVFSSAPLANKESRNESCGFFRFYPLFISIFPKKTIFFHFSVKTTLFQTTTSSLQYIS